MDIGKSTTLSESRIDRAISLLASPFENWDDFFKAAVHAVSIGLDCKWAVIGELAPGGTSVNVLAFWNDGELAEPFTYDLAEGPCEEVYDRNRKDVHHFYPDRVTDLFPDFDLLKALGAKAYRGELFYDANGDPAGHVVALMDEAAGDSQEIRALFRLISQRTGAEYRRWKLQGALGKSERRYRNLVEMLPDNVITYRDGTIVYANATAANTLGAEAPAELVGESVADILHPEDRPDLVQRSRIVPGDSASFRRAVRRFRTQEGVYFPCETSCCEIEMDDAVATVVVFRDISRRRKLESQLRQSQKLEAVGKLTGGMAHDFNNLLAIIQGNAEILADEPNDERAIDAIERATQRGAELCTRMLAFGRRQTLVARPIDLCHLLGEFAGLIVRTIGAGLEIELDLAEDCWPIRADESQLETTVLNLALNARDAMPTGGTLTIACRNTSLDAGSAAAIGELEPGDYVLLSVTDTGAGMEPGVLCKAFEPFFTTRDSGIGSGLGLSMVHGFVKQSGGHTVINSTPGAGTTVEIYLPRESGRPTATRPETKPGAPRGAGETVLLIEDDPDVRHLTEQMLLKLGYVVQAVGAVAPARKALMNNPDIALIVSDIMLPGGANGVDFAREVREGDFDVKILFMSGYPAETVRDKIFLDDKSAFMRKPFRRHELAVKIRSLLDRP